MKQATEYFEYQQGFDDRVRITTRIPTSPAALDAIASGGSAHTFHVEVVTLSQYIARKFVIEHMSPKGLFYEFLAAHEWKSIYERFMDGFGNGICGSDSSIEWDWSHVRDSSWEAFENAAEWIIHYKWELAGLDAYVDYIKSSAKRLTDAGYAMTPVEFIDAIGA